MAALNESFLRQTNYLKWYLQWLSLIRRRFYKLRNGIVVIKLKENETIIQLIKKKNQKIATIIK